ncbi:MAG: hypothetical protein K9N23_08760 [Akkermansiaceae bacterium]|nr:hypothetical protein [Akkermansiaceae bacterium]
MKNNMACSFNLKADPGVIQAANIPVDEARFNQRLKEQAAEINRRFGDVHPAAGRPRFGVHPDGDQAPAGAP